MKTCISPAMLTVALGLVLAPVACARNGGPPPATEVGASQLAINDRSTSSGTKLNVTSPAFAPGGDIPLENTQYRGNIFPGLAWTAGPAGTKSYVVIMQDGDAISHGAPILHWTLVNIPPTVTKLDAAMTAPPDGAQYGPNIRGPMQAYAGPRTPPGPKHRYHLQVFALDTSVANDSSTTYSTLTGAMQGHVLASGEVVGLGHAPADSTKQ